jgi:antitoxin (DNA-binding transcriptional repressor) of toxin-antitoxin stability system
MEKIEVDVRELPDRILDLNERAAAGDEVVITVEGKPVAWLNPIPVPGGPRVLGFARGSFTYIAPDFDDPLPDEFWSGEER